GFTSICCMPNTNPVNDSGSITECLLKRACSVGLSRLFPVGAISKTLKGEQLADIGDQAEAGAAAISDDGRSVMNSLLMRRAAEYASTFGLAIMDHCEDTNLAASGVMNEGWVATELGLRGLPSAAEEAHVARDIALSKLTGAHFHLTHISSAGSVELIRAAKRKRINVTSDCTPHHLVLTDEAVRGYNTNFKVNPPLRSAEDVKELIRGLADGTIDAIASDHAPQGLIDKELGFDTAAFGVIGMETSLPVVLKLVHEKKLSLKRMIELFASGLNVLKKSKYSGGIKKGSAADITIFNVNDNVAIDSSKIYSRSRNTPFEGWKLKGKVLYTIVGGRVVFDHEKGISPAGGW
ncbi:MAG: dihydroorotase, partial [Deltaproteobacteria bacterium]|nr:dihydroorotase [Deltaproteobacteria bacterium]